jgi:hypothetical protein
MANQLSSSVHVCNVEEVGQANYRSFLTWHFTCPKCSTKQRIASGPSPVACAGCDQIYSIKGNGEVHREVSARSRAVSQNSASAAHGQVNTARSGGFLSNLVGAAVEANEAAHGKRLKDGLISTGAHLNKLEEHVLARAMDRFVEQCNQLASEQANWSASGRIKLGRDLQARARKEFDFNQAESHALWLAGAWLESGSRTSEDAAFVRRSLEVLRQRL